MFLYCIYAQSSRILRILLCANEASDQRPAPAITAQSDTALAITVPPETAQVITYKELKFGQPRYLADLSIHQQQGRATRSEGQCRLYQRVPSCQIDHLEVFVTPLHQAGTYYHLICELRKLFRLLNWIKDIHVLDSLDRLDCASQPYGVLALYKNHVSLLTYLLIINVVYGVELYFQSDKI